MDKKGGGGGVSESVNNISHGRVHKLGSMEAMDSKLPSAAIVL